MIKICAVCGKPFEAGTGPHSRAKCCGPECSRIRKNSYNAEYRNQGYVGCGEKMNVCENSRCEFFTQKQKNRCKILTSVEEVCSFFKQRENANHPCVRCSRAGNIKCSGVFGFCNVLSDWEVRH